MSAALKEHPIPSRRPRLILVPPMEDAVVAPTIYRRRRLLAAGVALLAVFTLWFLAHGLFAFLSGDAPAERDGAQELRALVSDASGQRVTVRPGDTLWSIAQEAHPKGDIRPVLNRLAERYGSTPLVPGTSIVVSS